MKNLRILKEEPTFESPTGKVLLGSSLNRISARKIPKKYTKGVNQFIDLTNEEFSNYYLNPYLNLSLYRKGIF